MARPSTPLLLDQIRNPQSSADLVAGLRALKNDIVGHPLKKEMWVELGIIDPIIRILASRKNSVARNSDERTDGRKVLNEDEMTRLQALCIIGSLSYGGPAFLTPLHSTPVLPSILSHLNPTSNSPQLVLAALRALANLADSVSLMTVAHPLNTSNLADSLFARPHVNSLNRILSQSSSTLSTQCQISLTTSLIRKLCRDERHQMSLANAGVLDSLASKIAAVVISQGLVIPGAEILARREGTMDSFPPPAPANTDFAGILEATAVIITNSKHRALQLLYSEEITQIFPTSPLIEFRPNRSIKSAWAAFNMMDLSGRQSILNAMDYQIPQIPLQQMRSASALSSAFPPLGSQGSSEQFVQLGGSRMTGWPRTLSFESGSLHEDGTTSEPESPLIAYLLWVVRSSRHLEQLAAASVLTVLYRAGLASASRESALGLLLVPLLVQLIEESNSDIPKDFESSSDVDLHGLYWTLQERAPAVLAMLIVDSEYLQKAAYETGVISQLSKMFKLAYEPVIDNPRAGAWSPGDTIANPDDSTPISRQYQQGLSPLLMHKIKVRESVLRAIAALIPFKDEYRKALIDQGVVPYLVESLRSIPDKPSVKMMDKNDKSAKSDAETIPPSPGYGVNPVSVLIAACGAVRHLSRSVSIIRTTLIDNGIVMPVFALLQHNDIEVQIAATATVCNMVTDFSPMRDVSIPLAAYALHFDSVQTISDAGVLRILCEHAHSGNVRLRLNALWALKHLVHSADNEIKKKCLDELGQGWLVRLICNDIEDDSLSSTGSASATTGIAADLDDDMQVDQFEDDEDSRMADSLGASDNGASTQEGKRSSHPTGPSSVNARLASLRDLESNPIRRARKDDIAVQEQGLEFIRNLIGHVNSGGSTDTQEMIDFLFAALGQDQLFEILASKLRPRVTNPFNKRGSAGTYLETRVTPPHAAIVAAVGYILVHVAASIPRHRQLLISQTELLKLLIPQYNHPNKDVRTALCWVVINLTWIDNPQDGSACAQRAHELKRLGFLSKLEALAHDPELDVRERAKTAVFQMKQHGC